LKQDTNTEELGAEGDDGGGSAKSYMVLENQD